MLNANLIITMAGNYKRFKQQGYQIPKYLLPWGANSILDEILTQLNHKNIFKNIYLIANKKDITYVPHIKRIMIKQRIPLTNITLINDTSGQAETADISLNQLPLNDDMVFFHNVDTIIYNRDLPLIKEILSNSDGFIDIFQSNNHNYSYVNLSSSNKVIDIAEKIVVSDKATSGFYGFHDKQTYRKYYNTTDKYISDVYRRMITKKCCIRVGILHKEKDTIVLGTPSQYTSSVFLLDLKEG